MIDDVIRVQARDTYEDGQTRTAAAVRASDARARTIGLVRVGVVLAVIALVGAIVWVPLSNRAWFGVFALAFAFVALVVVHARVFAAKERAVAAQRFYQRGLDRLDDRWTAFPSTGERFRSAAHPFADDLDIFGKASLFQLVDATETRFGEERLAAWLSSTEIPARWIEDLRARQRAAEDLRTRVAFRERLASVGAMLGAEKPDPRPFLTWAEGASPMPHGLTLRGLAWGLPVLAVLVMGFASDVHLPRGSWIAVVLAEILLLAAMRPRTAAILGAVSSRERALAGYAEMFAAIEAEPFEAPLLLRLKERLSASGANVTREMARLGRIVGFADARENEVFRLFIAPVLLWDIHCTMALERWRGRAGMSARGWFEALGELEALASLAGFAYDHDGFVWPEFAEEPRFEGTVFGHPLIAAGRRVCNDLALAGPGTAVVVTGSNMSGKSTLLRSMGINAVLALAGAPVCAERMVIGPLSVATSMRVRDSLEEGVSHFYAELQKLKRVIDLCRGRPGVFFLLDEILHGTNSRERLIGARAVVRELLARGALGAVSTHDLGIGDLTSELPSQVRNAHFEEQVAADDKMTFDYKLRDGIVQSSNALRLMKIVGIDVV